jgi:hypothetical protein
VAKRGQSAQIVDKEGMIFVNCHTNVTSKFGVCGVYLSRSGKTKQGNKNRKSVSKQIGKKTI